MEYNLYLVGYSGIVGGQMCHGAALVAAPDDKTVYSDPVAAVGELVQKRFWPALQIDTCKDVSSNPFVIRVLGGDESVSVDVRVRSMT